MKLPRVTKSAEHGKYLIHAYSVLPSNACVVYEAWEDYAGHSAVTFIEGRRLGRVGSRDLPESIAQLRGGSAERIAAVDAWHEAQHEEATRAILAVYPEAALGKKALTGELEVWRQS